MYDDHLGCHREPLPGEEVFLGTGAMSMGWSWTLFFCQEGSAHAAAASVIGGLSRQLVDKRPAPVLGPGGPLAFTYVDNHTIFVGSAEALSLLWILLRRCALNGGCPRMGPSLCSGH